MRCACRCPRACSPSHYVYPVVRRDSSSMHDHHVYARSYVCPPCTHRQHVKTPPWRMVVQQYLSTKTCILHRGGVCASAFASLAYTCNGSLSRMHARENPRVNFMPQKRTRGCSIKKMHRPAYFKKRHAASRPPQVIFGAIFPLLRANRWCGATFK